MNPIVKALACGAALLAASAASANPALQRSGTVSWTCGGVGADERRAMEALRPEARLEVLFVTQKRGGFVSDARLSVYGPRGEPLLQVTADGPVCLIDAPAGTYRLEATYEGVTREAKARIAAAGAPHRVVLAFPEQEWDGIQASPEEKAQAAEP